MGKFLQKIVDAIYIYFLKLRGPRSLAFTNSDYVDIGRLDIKNIRGYTVSIHCKVFTYEFIYNKKILKPKKYYIYKVSGDATDNSPEKLKRALKEPAFFPRLSTLNLSDEAHNKLLVEAYLDTIIERLK